MSFFVYSPPPSRDPLTLKNVFFSLSALFCVRRFLIWEMQRGAEGQGLKTRAHLSFFFAIRHCVSRVLTSLSSLVWLPLLHLCAYFAIPHNCIVCICTQNVPISYVYTYLGALLKHEYSSELRSREVQSNEQLSKGRGGGLRVGVVFKLHYGVSWFGGRLVGG